MIASELEKKKFKGYEKSSIYCNKIRRLIEHIDSGRIQSEIQPHSVIVASSALETEKLVRTTCEVLDNCLFYQPYASKFYDAANFEKNMYKAMRRAVEQEN